MTRWRPVAYLGPAILLLMTTHRIVSTGKTPIHNLIVELKEAAK